ncbi:MAG: hypothetical protein RMK89_09305 [Armatimonadota bacterium]|nr:hypothetical protein [Armatimonadota bacterium]MDW8143644.1 hypothetical protein [Armatimonadota bacterium]
MNFLREGNEVICDSAYTNFAWGKEKGWDKVETEREEGGKRHEGERWGW